MHQLRIISIIPNSLHNTWLSCPTHTFTQFYFVSKPQHSPIHKNRPYHNYTRLRCPGFTLTTLLQCHSTLVSFAQGFLVLRITLHLISFAYLCLNGGVQVSWLTSMSTRHSSLLIYPSSPAIHPDSPHTRQTRITFPSTITPSLKH